MKKGKFLLSFIAFIAMTFGAIAQNTTSAGAAVFNKINLSGVNLHTSRSNYFQPSISDSSLRSE